MFIINFIHKLGRSHNITQKILEGANINGIVRLRCSRRGGVNGYPAFHTGLLKLNHFVVLYRQQLRVFKNVYIIILHGLPSRSLVAIFLKSAFAILTPFELSTA